MKAKHTPGYWVVHDHNDKRHREFAVMTWAKGDHDHRIKVASVPNHHVDWDTCRANAHLIAAAPELLARLEQALEYLENPEVQAIPFAKHASVMAAQMREAISNAKGEQ